jgi:hypothetical protein
LPGDGPFMSEDELDTLLGDDGAFMQLDDAEVQSNSTASTQVLGNADDVGTASSTAPSNKRLRRSDY